MIVLKLVPIDSTKKKPSNTTCLGSRVGKMRYHINNNSQLFMIYNIHGFQAPFNKGIFKQNNRCTNISLYKEIEVILLALKINYLDLSFVFISLKHPDTIS